MQTQSYETDYLFLSQAEVERRGGCIYQLDPNIGPQTHESLTGPTGSLCITFLDKQEKQDQTSDN